MVGILFTGGTISMTVDRMTGAAVPALGASEILERVPGLDEIADVEAEDFSRLPGPHVTPEQMWRLARRAAAWLARPDVDGLVVIHGTDTIEETAFLLDLVLLTEKPVVFAGAMRPASDPGWDGPANLVNAVRVAACPTARGRGVLVVMDELVLPAREARKVHAESSGSFATPEFGPLGAIDAGRVIFRRNLVERGLPRDAHADDGLRVRGLETRVELVQVYTGMSDRGLRSFDEEMKGLAIVAFGRGNVPPSVVPAIGAVVDAGALVTVSSRCAAGRVGPRYGYPGGGLELQRLGAVLAGELSGAKARLLQMVALGLAPDATRARDLVKDFVDT
jgi:L-asparaginase